MVEQWNRDSEGWWNSDSEGRWISSTVSQSYDSKGGDKETSEKFISDFRIPHRRRKNTIEGLPVTDALHLAVTGENKR